MMPVAEASTSVSENLALATRAAILLFVFIEAERSFLRRPNYWTNGGGGILPLPGETTTQRIQRLG